MAQAALTIDGLGVDYVAQSEMPVFKGMMAKGFSRMVSAVMPTVTNVNNASICCGASPAEDGITGNPFFDETNGQTEYMEGAEYLRMPTLFERAARQGLKSALLTAYLWGPLPFARADLAYWGPDHPVAQAFRQIAADIPPGAPVRCPQLDQSAAVLEPRLGGFEHVDGLAHQGDPLLAAFDQARHAQRRPDRPRRAEGHRLLELGGHVLSRFVGASQPQLGQRGRHSPLAEDGRVDADDRTVQVH